MTVSIAKRPLTIFLSSLFALLLVAACGEQEQGGGEQGNGGGEQGGGGGEEAVSVGNFTDWDANNNNELTQEEFNTGVFESTDADNSGTIKEEELNAFSEAETWFSDINANFTDWDLNNNNELTQEEFNQGIDDVVFSGWDADNNDLLDEKEFQAGMEKPQGG